MPANRSNTSWASKYTGPSNPLRQYSKKKWTVNSGFMALYTFTAVPICRLVWAFEMSFGDLLLPFWGKPGFALGQRHLLAEDTSFTGLYLRHMHTCSEPPPPSSSTSLDSPSPPHSTALLSYGLMSKGTYKTINRCIIIDISNIRTNYSSWQKQNQFK